MVEEFRVHPTKGIRVNPSGLHLPASRPKSVRKRLLLIMLIGLALRLAVTPFNEIEGLLNADHLYAWEQGNVARSLVAGHGFGSPLVSTQSSAIMPPVFPLVVAGAFELFGVHTPASIFAVHAFNCVISVLATIPVFLLARRTFGRRVAWWSAWAWAFSPYGIYFAAAWAWSTHILLLCLCWMLYLAQDLAESSRLKLWVGFGLLAGFAALTEPSILLILPVLMGVAMWQLWRAGKSWFVPALVGSITVFAVLTPWTVRNAMVFHKFIPMRDSMGLEMWMGNNGYDLRWTTDDLHPLHDMQELADYNRMGELAYMQHKSDLAHAYIAAHPGWYAVTCVRRAVYIWTSYWSFSKAYLALEPTDLANIPFSITLNLLGFSGLVLMWRTHRMDAIRFLGVMMILPSMYYFAHPEPYHLRPLDPLIAILGCYAVYTWREHAAEPALLPEAVET
jgi:4-amino-4-deoxy-L-arabinose transferase-like glycosyltransferase